MISENGRKILGNNIRKYRKQKGLTQTELGEKVNCSTSCIMHYEKAQRKPDLYTVELIAEALEIDPQLLLGVEYIKLKFPDLGKQITRRESFIDFLKSNDYIVEQTIDGAELAELKGNSPEQDVKIKRDKTEYHLTESEFEALQNSAQYTIEFELWKHNQKERKNES